MVPRFSEESEIPESLPRVPLAPPRPTQGPRSAGAFVESLRGTDATFDVLVNQARILTLKQDIVAGPAQPLIAVGDPTVLDFTVLNARQIRITGRAIGVTDLSITTARNETYTFEVRVHADLTLIHSKLRSTFPDATIKLSQIRDHFVVEGEARDQAQITRIMQTINAYLNSVFIQQGRTATVGQTGQLYRALGGVGGGVGAAGQRLGAGSAQVLAPGLVVPLQPGAEAAPGIAPGTGTDGAGNPFAAYGASNELAGPTQVSDRGAPPRSST